MNNYYNNQQQDRELGWDDVIQNDGFEVKPVFPEGDYKFIIVNHEKKRYEPSEYAKLPPCPMAELQVRLLSPEHGTTDVTHRLYLHTMTEGFLSQFFAAIGQKRKGEKFRMNWDEVNGSEGMCKVGIREWTNDKGERREANEIIQFYPAEEIATKAPARAQQPAKKEFVPGQF